MDDFCVQSFWQNLKNSVIYYLFMRILGDRLPAQAGLTVGHVVRIYFKKLSQKVVLCWKYQQN
jgi:hypothetical protein